MGVKNVRRCIDDTLLYANNLGEAFKQVGEYLTLVGNNGIILNPDKFVLGKDVIDWAGVRLLKDKAEPLPDHVKAFRELLCSGQPICTILCSAAPPSTI